MPLDDYDPWNPNQFAPASSGYPQMQPGDAQMIGGAGSNDPLFDWASNMTPDQMKDFAMRHAIGDQEGAKQSMIDAGIPPPDHHYTRDLAGNLQASMPPMRDPSQGNLTDDTNQSPKRMALTDELKPEETGPSPAVEAIKKNLNKFDTAKPPPPQTKPLIEQTGPPVTPSEQQLRDAAPGSVFDPIRRIWERGFGTGPYGKPEEKKSDTTAPPLTTTQVGPARGTPGSYATTERQEPEQKPADDVKKEEVTMGDKLAKLGKALSGIKAPPKAELPRIGAPSVHANHAVSPPNLANLLALAGQSLPSQHLNLTRLLGRSY